ncbi:hypothetical protein C6503_19780 [Candidatus Poribacteria bacterium]|nr:MAG: hypothetical protein C6503_19780 [Candidatus Poribacteria bacterium]
MAQYDISAKYLLLKHSKALIEYFLGRQNVEILEHLNTDQPTFKSHRGDSTTRIRIDGEEVIVHLEVQSGNSPKPMWARLAAYCGFLISEFQRPVYCIVLYLGPSAGQNDPGYYAYETAEFRYLIQYKVIRLAEIDGQSVLETQAPALLPFTPLMKPPADISAEQWLEKCVASAETAPVEKAVRDDLVATLGIFGALVYDTRLVNQLIKEEIVQKSTFFQEHLERATKRLEETTERLRQEALAQGLEQGLQQGIEQGKAQGVEQERRESAIRHILIVLRTKFSADIVTVLTPAIENISDVEQLEQLLPAAVEAQSLEAFARILHESGS